MKALTLHQPWASAIAFGIKKYETRPRKTNHRGLLAIHAGKSFNDAGINTAFDVNWLEHITLPLSRRYSPISSKDFPSGAIVAVGEVTDCIEMDEEFINAQSEQELALGNWEVGRYAYLIENLQALADPVIVSGKQGMWNLVGDQLKAVEDQLIHTEA